MTRRRCREKPNPEGLRSLLRAEGWEKRPYGVTGWPFWFRPSR